MIIIPAIDLKEGKCVRLRQGKMEDETIFADNPVDMAKQWIEQGGERLHLVDLDGAFAGKPVHGEIINEICKNHPTIPIQVGGGIRDAKTIAAYLDVGIRYTIIGTKAVQSPNFIKEVCQSFPGHIIVGLDAQNNQIATEGWAKSSGRDLTDTAKIFEDYGVSAIVYTDISKDGMMAGCNVASTVALAASISIPVIASGGVSSMQDIEQLNKVSNGIMGAIIGRALYEGVIDLKRAIKISMKN